jgi:hypothetical protein
MRHRIRIGTTGVVQDLIPDVNGGHKAPPFPSMMPDSAAVIEDGRSPGGMASARRSRLSVTGRQACPPRYNSRSNGICAGHRCAGASGPGHEQADADMQS